MERDFQSMLLAGEGTGVISPAFTADDPYFNGMYSGISFQSLIGLSQEKILLPSLDYPYGTSAMTDPVPFGYFIDDIPAIQNKQLGDCSTYGDRKPKIIDFVADSKLKMPKMEPLNNVEFNDVSTEPFSFMSKSSDLIPSLCDSSFRQLPDLRSLEHVHPEDFALAESPRKRVKSFAPPTTDPYAVESILRNFQMSNYLEAAEEAACKAPVFRAPAPVPPSQLARQRRQRISDKTRCLQKLLPWDKKMNKATMFEEAYKYVKFLQAQVSVLQSMPCDSPSSLSIATQNPSDGNTMFGGLGRLNRKQLLEVLVNSPLAQTIMYSQGVCVYSTEQLVLLKEIAARKLDLQQLMFEPSMFS